MTRASSFLPADDAVDLALAGFGSQIGAELVEEFAPFVRLGAVAVARSTAFAGILAGFADFVGFLPTAAGSSSLLPLLSLSSSELPQSDPGRHCRSGSSMSRLPLIRDLKQAFRALAVHLGHDIVHPVGQFVDIAVVDTGLGRTVRPCRRGRSGKHISGRGLR